MMRMRLCATWALITGLTMLMTTACSPQGDASKSNETEDDAATVAEPVTSDIDLSQLGMPEIEDVPVVITNARDWLKVKEAQIATWRIHIETLKEVVAIVPQLTSAQTPTPNGFGLHSYGLQQSAEDRLNLAAQALQNQGIAIENYSKMLNSNAQYAKAMADIRFRYGQMSNLGWEQYISNQKGLLTNGRLAIDNDGARIENFGKMLKNRSQHLENVLKELEIVLKNFYAIAYRNYVRAYGEYSEQIQKVWKTIGQVNSQVGGAILELKKYRRQARLCESRRKRLWRHKLAESNAELHSKKVTLSNVQRIFRTLSSTEEGEACLHKTLLTSSFLSAKELGKIEYEVGLSSGPKPRIECPVATELDVVGMDVMDYPMPMINEETYQVEGYFQPLTYYQMFRVLTDVESDVAISKPPINTAASGCNMYHPGTKKFRTDSLMIEKALSDSYDTPVGNVASSQTFGYTTSYTGIHPSNQVYRTVLDRLTTIFRKTEACVQSYDTEIVAENPDATAPTDATLITDPLTAGAPAFSDMNTFQDPNFPLMSESIRECMRMAEHHRYRAFAQLEVVDALYDVMQKATELAPPKSPHPVQFTPAGYGQPGN